MSRDASRDGTNHRCDLLQHVHVVESAVDRGEHHDGRQKSVSALRLWLEDLSKVATRGPLPSLAAAAATGTTRLSKGLTWDEAALMLVESVDVKDAHILRAVGYWALGCTLNGPLTLENGRTMNQQQCFVEAIGCGSRSGRVYVDLGSILQAGESVTLRDGRTVRRQRCFMEAIGCCHSCSVAAYNSLGNGLDPWDVVALHDGRTVSKWQCYAEAVVCICSSNRGSVLSTHQSCVEASCL